MPSDTPSRETHSSRLSSGFAIAILFAILAITVALLTPARTLLSKRLPSTFTNSSKRTMATVAGTTNHTANGSPAKSSNLMVTKRPWDARGHADHDWLYTYHTFSFAGYHDPKYESFGPLRVINEDRVERGTGFGTHSHAEFLIFSYIVAGELEHKDSMGNLENLRRGEVQFTSAGTGIRHSEYNRNKNEDVHFLQIWAKPNVRGLKPSYATQKYTDEMKKDRLVRIMESTDRHDGSTESGAAIPLQSDLSMDASILSPGKSVTHELVKDGTRLVYLHVVMGGKKQPKQGGARITVGGKTLGEGDGAFVRAQTGDKVEVESVGDKPAEFLLFDMGEQQ